jgi:hypothetical protein
MTRVTQAIALALLTIAACRPSTIAEAERRGDVPWLEENGTPDAVAALGRLADKDPKALAALESRSSFDVQAFKVAWAAGLRGSPWGAPLLRGALADPKRADFAASGMGRHEPALLPFVGDLENALVRVAASTRNVNIATALASVGPEARAAVERRLREPSTRGAMCRGIASKESDADARSALRVVPEAARDDPACVEAAVRVAADEDATLAWMAERAEPGILGAAGKGDSMPCARLHVAWNKALGARTSDAYPALTVPLAYAVKRCPAEMDGILADAIVHLPAARGVVVQAIDPFGDYGAALRATCAALPVVAGGHDAAILRERASDALQHACVKSG